MDEAVKEAVALCNCIVPDWLAEARVEQLLDEVLGPDAI